MENSTKTKFTQNKNTLRYQVKQFFRYLELSIDQIIFTFRESISRTLE